MRRTRIHSIAYCGLAIALLAVSNLFTIPLGPVPFTLETMVLVIILCTLSPGEAIACVACFLLMGAFGLPVFSGMRGGLSVLTGPTGGFLFGFLVGMAVAAPLRAFLLKLKPDGWMADIVSAVVLLVISYALGWAQLMVVAGMGPGAAFLAACAPFIIPDAIKIAVGIMVARAVTRALGLGPVRETPTEA